MHALYDHGMIAQVNYLHLTLPNGLTFKNLGNARHIYCIYDNSPMKKKLGRPRLKAKERKEIVPMRVSSIELKVLKVAAKDQPLTTWMRDTLLTAAGYKENGLI